MNTLRLTIAYSFKIFTFSITLIKVRVLKFEHLTLAFKFERFTLNFTFKDKVLCQWRITNVYSTQKINATVCLNHILKEKTEILAVEILRSN